MICYLQKPSGWWKAAAFHQPLLSLSPTKNVNYTSKLLGISSRCNESECGLPRTMRSSGNVSDDGKMPSSKTSATPACLPMTCEPHKYGGYPQTRYTGTGHLPHIRPQAADILKLATPAPATCLTYGHRRCLRGRCFAENYFCLRVVSSTRPTPSSLDTDTDTISPGVSWSKTSAVVLTPST